MVVVVVVVVPVMRRVIEFPNAILGRVTYEDDSIVERFEALWMKSKGEATWTIF